MAAGCVSWIEGDTLTQKMGLRESLLECGGKKVCVR